MLDRVRTNGFLVAYMNKSEKNESYTVIPNNFGCYAADPFIFIEEGDIYIFAEIYIYTKGKGSLGYCKIVEGKPSKWKVVIEEDYHLSYPNIFKVDDEIYICPESSENNSIYFYKATLFPDKWEKNKTLISNMMCCDTTFIKIADKSYGFTYRIDNDLHDLLLFKIDDGMVEFCSENPINTDLGSARPGGNIINENGKLIRVSQDCIPYYGHGVVFSEINLNWPYYSEKIIRKIYPEKINIKINRKYKKIGIHTYNRNDDIEVIDLQFKHMSLYTLFWRVENKLRKVLLKRCDKYMG